MYKANNGNNIRRKGNFDTNKNRCEEHEALAVAQFAHPFATTAK
jgi:hypothetical protein